MFIMKRVFSALFLLIISLFFVTSVSAQIRVIVGERIDKFQADININKDGTMIVNERITYNFATEERHGIFRKIPVIKTNKEGKRFKLDIKVLSVKDEKGKKYKYEKSLENNYYTIKIGDADKYVTGQKVYNISYQVSGALTYFQDHDELYWNVTGNEWPVPILETEAVVSLPQDFSSDRLKALCFTGYQGSEERFCEASIAGTNHKFIAADLAEQQGLTIVAAFPKNAVAVLEPKPYKEFFETFIGKIVLIGLFFLAFLWYIVYPLWLPIKWFLQGRDPQGKGELSAWYDPPKTKAGRFLTPAESGTLVDEHAEMRDISSMIVNLAQRGYLKIIEKEKKDFYFKKTQGFADDKNLMSFEKKLLEGFFSTDDEIRIKDENLVTTVEAIYDQLYKSMVKEGFFPKNPKDVRDFYKVMVALSLFTFNLPLLLSASIFGRLMPHKTLEGVHATELVRSMKNFLTSQERQLEFQADKQMMFEKLLPYAIALGVEKIWAERFQDIEMKLDWYKGYGQGHMYTADSLTSGLRSSFSSVQSVATPTTSSSGFSSGSSGGSSGGGGGGGGGGSW
jgi:uncharacterized membrane protein